MNSEIKSQNEELKAQNDQIIQQREELEVAQEKLQYTNDKLEKLVDERTKKLRATIKELDKTVFELDRFVYSASHDLSAPLKSILGLIRLAKMENQINRLHEYHTYIEGSIEKLELVIKSLIDYSKNSHLQLEIQPVYPYFVIQEIVQELGYLPEAKGIEIENKLPADLTLHSDLGRLKLIMQNLIGNAIKYSDPDKMRNFIKIDFELNDKLRIIVKDNGIGIDEICLPKIFSMYYRATEKSKGSGLGLFIVKETVHKIQGSVAVESIIDEGSTFIVELPLELKAQVDVEIRSAISN